jgi:ketosteroid isomerase-like protein
LIDEFPRFKHEVDSQEIMVATSGDVAIVRGAYRFEADSLKTSEMQRGKFVGVWVNIDQDWRLRINISNNDGSETW